MVLQASWGHFLALMGICCSTFVSISRGSTFRSEFLPEGTPVSIAVYKANKGLCRPGCQKNIYNIQSLKVTPMVWGHVVVINPDRCVLILILIIACGGVPLIENPGSTLLNAHRRFQHLVTLLRSCGISTLAGK